MDANKIQIIHNVVVAFAAFVGLGLGIYNFYNEREKDKVTLSILPKSVMKKGIDGQSGREMYFRSTEDYNPSPPEDMFSIVIVNQSKFSVTVDEVGFLTKGKLRMSVSSPLILDGRGWPRKLEPRDTIGVYCSHKSLLTDQKVSEVKYAYACTTCGF